MIIPLHLSSFHSICMTHFFQKLHPSCRQPNPLTTDVQSFILSHLTLPPRYGHQDPANILGQHHHKPNHGICGLILVFLLAIFRRLTPTGTDLISPLARARRQGCIDACHDTYSSDQRSQARTPGMQAVLAEGDVCLKRSPRFTQVYHATLFHVLSKSSWLTKDPLQQKLYRVPRDETSRTSQTTHLVVMQPTLRTEPRTERIHPSSRSTRFDLSVMSLPGPRVRSILHRELGGDGKRRVTLWWRPASSYSYSRGPPGQTLPRGP